MDKSLKRITVRTGGGPQTGEAIIDPASPTTMLTLELARRLGVDPRNAVRPGTILVGGERLTGFRIPVIIKVGGRDACVDGFVPCKRRKNAKEEDFELEVCVIGTDFFEALERKPKGVPRIGLGGSTFRKFRPATPEEKEILRKFRVGGGMARFVKLTPEKQEARRTPPRRKLGKSRKGSR